MGNSPLAARLRIPGDPHSTQPPPARLAAYIASVGALQQPLALGRVQGQDRHADARAELQRGVRPGRRDPQGAQQGAAKLRRDVHRRVGVGDALEHADELVAALQRATASVARSEASSRSPTARSSASPTRWPWVSFTGLNRSRSMNTAATRVP